MNAPRSLRTKPGPQTRPQTRASPGCEAGAQPEVTPLVRDVLRSPGRPLDPAHRAFMEPRLGHDFGQVRVHTGARAAQSARALNARAYTVGREVVFGAGQYAPGTAAGLTLLAQELTHVVQQRGVTSMPARLHAGQEDDRFEREAERVSREAASNAPVFASQLAPAGHGPAEEADEPFARTIAPMAHPASIGRLSASPAGVVQRAASFVAGSVHSGRNIAARIAAGNNQLGFTPPLLNGNRIMSEDQAVAAIRPPTIRSRTPGMSDSPLGEPSAFEAGRGFSDPIHDPLIEAYRRQRGLPPEGVDEFGHPVGPTAAEIKYGGLLPDVECWVESVPTNTGSFEMFLPAPGPWSTVTTRGNVAARMTALGLTPPAPCSAAAGDSTFSIHGLPSDGDLLANLRTHETQHATDHQTVFDAVAVPWDAALTAASTTRRIFRAPGISGCESALYAALGGTPEQIARNLWAGWIGANHAFHATPAGAAATPSNPQADADCGNSSIDVFHP